MISIQAVDAGDYPALLALWRRSVEATHAFLTAADVDEIEQDVAAYLPQMPDLRVAVEGGTLVGFIAVSGATVEMLFVDSDAQGRGIGSALLQAAAAGHDAVRVDVNEQNASGRAFYAARGFSEVGRSEVDGEGRPFPILHLQLLVLEPPARPA
ncbi:GNAT family N-acetyltransferase [Paenarthrobacter nitroguajacolicus]|uniref:GNAT family N-acetyltransferase n=1 Tax=Paenarthrobacter nitroguajacolicus TaxID=211146 RepID=A0A558GRZ5_PAENT|nr:GNAT family N-acetyltransferase [Paenarthrobacter nitroguajacolicus]TVU59654.1 GNAT family N-acetyltransferase [Paenarthrobacter nitroguajacolicus]